MVLSEAAESIVDETAFAGNDIDYFGDPLVQKIVAVFGVVVLLLLAANALFGQMDTAIEKVLVDFETVMKRDYTSRWVDIREQLDKLDNGMERQTKLFEIMEDLQKKDPELYSRVNEKMEKI